MKKKTASSLRSTRISTSFRAPVAGHDGGALRLLYTSVTRISKETKLLFTTILIMFHCVLLTLDLHENSATCVNSKNQIARYQPSAIGRTVRRATLDRPSLRRDPSPPMVCRPPKRRLRRTALREASPGCRSDGRGQSQPPAIPVRPSMGLFIPASEGNPSHYRSGARGVRRAVGGQVEVVQSES